MFYKEEFISADFSDTFIHVGHHDVDELCKSEYRNDKNVSVEMDALHCLEYFPCAENLILQPGLLNIDDLHYLYKLPLKRLILNYYNDKLCEYSIDLGQFSDLEFVSSRDSYNFINIDKCCSLKILNVFH